MIFDLKGVNMNWMIIYLKYRNLVFNNKIYFLNIKYVIRKLSYFRFISDLSVEYVLKCCCEN